MKKKRLKHAIPDLKETLPWLSLELIEKNEKNGFFLPGERYPGKKPQDFLLFLQEDNEFLCALPEIAATMIFPNNEISRGLTYFSITDKDSAYLTKSKFWWKYIKEYELVWKRAIVAGIISRTQHMCYQAFSDQVHDKGKSAKFAHYVINCEEMKKFWSIVFNDSSLPISHAKKIHTDFKLVLHFLASFVVVKSLMFKAKFCKEVYPSDDEILRTFLALSYEHYRFRQKHGIEGWLPSNFYKLLEMFKIDSMMVGISDFEPIPSAFLNRKLAEYISEKAYRGV